MVGSPLPGERKMTEKWKQHFDQNYTKETTMSRLVHKSWGLGWRDNLPQSQKIDHLECKNFRAIVFLNVTYSVLTKIIFRHLSLLNNEFVGINQAGFIDGRSTSNQTFTVRQIICSSTSRWQTIVWIARRYEYSWTDTAFLRSWSLHNNVR